MYVECIRPGSSTQSSTLPASQRSHWRVYEVAAGSHVPTLELSLDPAVGEEDRSIAGGLTACGVQSIAARSYAPMSRMPSGHPAGVPGRTRGLPARSVVDTPGPSGPGSPRSTAGAVGVRLQSNGEPPTNCLATFDFLLPLLPGAQSTVTWGSATTSWRSV